MKLIFVYNAKSDRLNNIVDFAHKIVSPSTYNCDLCKLTHTNLSERELWTSLKKEANLEFYHINEFEKKFNQKFNYPVILNNDLELLLDKKEIAQLKNVSELIQKIKEIINL